MATRNVVLSAVLVVYYVPLAARYLILSLDLLEFQYVMHDDKYKYKQISDDDGESSARK